MHGVSSSRPTRKSITPYGSDTAPDTRQVLAKKPMSCFEVQAPPAARLNPTILIDGGAEKKTLRRGRPLRPSLQPVPV